MDTQLTHAEDVPINIEQIEKPPTTMAEIMKVMDDYDEMLTDLDDEQLAALVALLRDKTDSYKHVIDSFEDRAKRLRTNAAQLSDAAKSMENKAKRIREVLAFNMKARGWTKAPGDIWSATLVTRKDVKFNEVECNSKLFNEHPTLIKREYKWDKPAVKAAFKADPEGPISKFCEMVENSAVRFNVNKGV